MALAYRRFEDAPSASAFLGSEPGARLLGGGTLLVRDVNEGDIGLTTYVRVSDPGLRAIEHEQSTIRLGALVTMAQIMRDPGLAPLAAAARTVGGPAVREAATVGGNLFARAPYGDFGVALLALDATVHMQRRGAAEMQPIADFFAERATLSADTIVTAVTFDSPARDQFRFAKASRVKPKGAAIVSIAALLTLEDGVVSRARIALGAMAQAPIRAIAFERALVGQPVTADVLKAIASTALEGTDPPTDAIASTWYRQAVLPTHLSRLLLA